MRRRLLTVILSALSSTAAWGVALVAALTPVAPASAATLEVGPGRSFATIGAAIAAASAGDVLNIHAGTYAERPFISKSLTLQANAGEVPLIYPSTTGYGITIAANGVTLDGLELKGWSGTYTRGIDAENVDRIVIRNCIVHDPGSPDTLAAIYVRNSTRVTIQNNSLYGNIGGPGISLVSSHSSDATYTNGTVVVGNTIYNNAVDGIDVHGEYVTIDSNLIYRNIDARWSNTHPDGIQLIASTVDGYADAAHVIIRRNTIFSHTQNIFVEGNPTTLHTGDVYVYNNVLYSETGIVNGVGLDGIATKGILVRNAGGAGRIYIDNNTIGRHSNDAIGLLDAGVAGSVSIRNNVISNNFGNSAPGVDVQVPSAISVLDYNLYDIAGGSMVKWLTTYYTSLPTFTPATGQEGHGKSGAALLSTGYTPTSASPAVDAGTDLSALFATDFAGTARPQGASWDIGAYELKPATTSPAPPANVVIK